MKASPRRERLSARGRLLATLDGLAFIAPHDAYKRRARIIRALRAHERELAERAVKFFISDMSIGGAGSPLAHEAGEMLRAAILGPQRAKKGPRP